MGCLALPLALNGSLVVMASPYTIRVFGDPVLRKVAEEITTIDGKLVKLADDMLETMYTEPGLGLAAPQVGVQRRLFVYDIGEGPQTLVNPVINEARGEWTYEEGCLSVPGLFWEIVRPKEIHLTGYNLDGNEVSIEADELLARLFQHELDHLDGVMLLDRLDADTRKEAMKAVRELFVDVDSARSAARQQRSGTRPTAGGLSLP
jgi:peptide deformylase